MSSAARKQRTEEKGGVETTGEIFPVDSPIFSQCAIQQPQRLHYRGKGRADAGGGG